MEALFLKAVNLSITASWLILAVLVLRFIFRSAPRWILCLLWGLVALRLAVPVSLESPLSLVPRAQPIPDSVIYEVTTDPGGGVPAPSQTAEPAAPGADGAEAVSDSSGPEARTAVSPVRLAVFIASRVWIVGAAVLLFYFAAGSFLLKQRMGTATLLRDNVRQSDRTDSPFVLGLFHPVIYLPYSVGGEEMDYVLAHEQAHIQRHDHWWKLIGFLILAVYWFDPLVWLAYILLCRDIELACDEKVVANMEQEERRAYSTALLNCSVRRLPPGLRRGGCEGPGQERDEL